MVKVSPTKEEAVRLTKLFDYAVKNQFVDVFGEEPTMAMVADRLGYTEERLRSILNGNSHRSSIEKVARAVTGWVKDGSLNADYVIVGGKVKMLKKVKAKAGESQAQQEVNDTEEELPMVEMDDELDEMSAADSIDMEDGLDDDELTELPEISDDDSDDDLYALDPDSQPDLPEDDEEDDSAKVHIESTANGYHVDAVNVGNKGTDIVQDALKEAAKDLGIEGKAKKTAAPKTAKDHWIDDAIDLGISADALNDHFMQLFSTRDGKLHLFKEPEGKLPYRQEIYEIQAVGLGKPSTISYYDDKVKYRVRYAVVHKGEVTLEASNESDAYTRLFEMLTRNKYYVNGKEQVYCDIVSDIDIISED